MIKRAGWTLKGAKRGRCRGVRLTRADFNSSRIRQDFTNAPVSYKRANSYPVEVTTSARGTQMEPQERARGEGWRREEAFKDDV